MNDIHLDRALSEEFAGNATQIHALKAADPAFKALLEFNHELWAEIQRIQESVAPADDDVLEDLEKSLHVHVVLGLSDGTTRGGHLVSGTVRPHELGCGGRR